MAVKTRNLNTFFSIIEETSFKAVSTTAVIARANEYWDSVAIVELFGTQ